MNQPIAIVTGCLRISKESIFTGLNNLKINSILSDNYAEYFGFTGSEVEEDVDDATHNYQQIVALGLNEADAQAAPAPAPAPEPTPAPAPETTNNGGNDEFIPVYGEQPGLGYGGTY